MDPPDRRDEEPKDAVMRQRASSTTTKTNKSLDCYPYTFSPLLLFAPESYFDKGYSNHNAVSQFFSACTLPEIDTCHNVLFEGKNMLYEELLDYVTENHSTVTCVIDGHSTAFQVLPGGRCIYYDPLHSGLQLVDKRSYVQFVSFMLLKCKYADSAHIQENKKHYMENEKRSTIYSLWKRINDIDLSNLRIHTTTIPLDLERYLLINNPRKFSAMSTQQTGNTCYFQTYLFVLLCKVCEPVLAPDGRSIILDNEDVLEKVTVKISRFLLEFFVKDDVIRPLTNSNVLIDFYRFEKAAYYDVFVRYLRHMNVAVPKYELQYDKLLDYYTDTVRLHSYGKFSISGFMPSSVNTKLLQMMVDTDAPKYRLFLFNYFKHRAANFMFGFNTNIMHRLRSFNEFNSLRKNQLLSCIEDIRDLIAKPYAGDNKYRDYYFMPMFEIGQQDLVDLHHFTYHVDIHAMMGKNPDSTLTDRIHAVNRLLVKKVLSSTNRTSDYEDWVDMAKSKNYQFFLNKFLSPDWFSEFCALGFPSIEPREKEFNSLTQTTFYQVDLMRAQSWRQSYEFGKECINQMARSTVTKFSAVFDGRVDLTQQYKVQIRIGHGFTYSKYNTLMHFLNSVEAYWQNPDINSIQIFGKDIRTLLVISCQKIFFEKGHSFYHFGCIDVPERRDYDLAMSASAGVLPSVARSSKSRNVIVTDRVYEYHYLRGMVDAMFARTKGLKIKTDDVVINLALLSLLLDLGLYEKHAACLNLPSIHSLQHGASTRELQVEVSNLISEFDKANRDSSVQRMHVEELICEASHKFMVNKNFSVHSREFEVINALNSDGVYQRYLLLCKLYISLCQINKSSEVDYYKIRCNNDHRIVIPANFSKTTADYLEAVTKRHTFGERGGFILHDDLVLFDVRAQQPAIDLLKVRFDPSSSVSSMVKYVEVSNVFRATTASQVSRLQPRKVKRQRSHSSDGGGAAGAAVAGAAGTPVPGEGVADDEETHDLIPGDKFLIFIADSTLVVDVGEAGSTSIRINGIQIEIDTIFFNRAMSFVPCFKYVDSEDVVVFTSRNLHYLVDSGGQFNIEYYGMRHELIGCINSEQLFLDLNDEHGFDKVKLSELLTESKTVFTFPDYLLQIENRQQLINLLDYACYIRNVSMFILVLFYLRRASVFLEFVEKEHDTKKITGPWKAAILYVMGDSTASNDHYDTIFAPQFFDLDQHEDLPLDAFIDVVAGNFEHYQQVVDGARAIVPRPQQKAFLRKIITAEECFHFSEVGSGKTKVILPLLCQIFISNNREAHRFFSRGGAKKNALIVLVPEHLVNDAVAQVLRYCLNLNFGDAYRIYDDIFALLHPKVQIVTSRGVAPKQIFVTSFNQLKKALTYDVICDKLHPHRDRILAVVDEVDDFLDRDKLVFNICSNTSNDFQKSVLENYFVASQAAYSGAPCPSFDGAENRDYWTDLYQKFLVIHAEIQEKSHSINKSFGIFNEQTLRHCSTNIAHDIEGYKSLIARPYESVNRAMPGSYYTDVERTIYLTYFILQEDMAKYNELFQQERKFLSFEFFSQYGWHIDFDELVYGSNRLSDVVLQHPETKDGLSRYLYAIILRRMEIRDKSRSVNSLDIVFNFDCIGFTGTPFIDNYPTFAYINQQREDNIPDLIDRSFYVYGNETVSQELFESRFTKFQGANHNVLVEYVASEFVQDADDELHILENIFKREGTDFNVLVDLCGVFKKMNIFMVRDLVLRYFGPDKFKYIYHISQGDGSDRVLYLNSDTDVQYDQEFYKYLCQSYGADLRERVFFFVDNRNVIGKDIPFQLGYRKRFNQPMFYRSVVLAHDVDDFSKIWQAMGRSRTMNDTKFTIYKNMIPDEEVSAQARMVAEGVPLFDIKKHPLTLELYVKNCDRKIIGNLSSIYQTIVSLYNLSRRKFYHKNDIVNVFLEKMQGTITDKVALHERNLASAIFSDRVTFGILMHIIENKLQKSTALAPSCGDVLADKKSVAELLVNIVRQKYEDRLPTDDIHDDLIRYLSGEQLSLMEISYTKQQQKQKQKQKQKNQDSDTMETFRDANQILISEQMENYFAYTLAPNRDHIKIQLDLPIPIPVVKLAYANEGVWKSIQVFPTLQFLYSLHIQAEYITKQVKAVLASYDPTRFDSAREFCARFTEEVARLHEEAQAQLAASAEPAAVELDCKVILRQIRQNPGYTLAALRPGVYIIGMKDQFNVHDIERHALREDIGYIADDTGFILHTSDKLRQPASKSVDSFGPYFIEQYLLLEVLSKHEVAQNVIEYYIQQKDKLERCIQAYDESKGQGFVCWRFIVTQAMTLPQANTKVGPSSLGAGGVSPS